MGKKSINQLRKDLLICKSVKVIYHFRKDSSLSNRIVKKVSKHFIEWLVDGNKKILDIPNKDFIEYVDNQFSIWDFGKRFELTEEESKDYTRVHFEDNKPYMFDYKKRGDLLFTFELVY